MRVVSLNVGMPKTVPWRGRLVTTGIFKSPVDHRIALRSLNFDGDRQADLQVHGGRDKTVYAYPAEHYPFWQKELAGREMPWGIFGENLSAEGLLEDEVFIGDEFQIGGARLVVTQPRLPCYKLGIRFGDPRMVNRFVEAGLPGIYFAVVTPGDVGPGDEITCVHRDENGLTVSELFAIETGGRPTSAELERVLAVPALAEVIRRRFTEMLNEV